MTFLTCEIVEEFQQAAQAGKSIDSIINSLDSATLPAVVEYGCARWHCQRLPVLPQSVVNLQIGQALAEVKSAIGFRIEGNQKLPPRSISPMPCEFYVLEGDSPTTSRDWQEFLVRFRQSAKSVGFSHEKAQGLAAALGEMADNSTLHARATVGALVGYQTTGNAVVCSIGDVGVGVLTSLRKIGISIPSNTCHSHKNCAP